MCFGLDRSPRMFRAIEIGSRQSDIPSSGFGSLDNYKQIGFAALSSCRASRSENEFEGPSFGTVIGEEQYSGTESIFIEETITVRDLNQAISHLASTVLSAHLQYRAMQQEQILEFSMERDYK